MPRRRFLPVTAIALVVLAAPALGLAGSSPSASSLRAENAHLAAKTRSAVLELYSLDARLGSARTHLAGLRRQSLVLRAQRASLARQLAVARRGNRLANEQLAARLRLLYEQGNVEPLEIVFGAKSLDEALTNLDNLSRMTDQGEDVLRELRSARSALGVAVNALASRRAALLAATRQANATAAGLDAARTARSRFVGALAAERAMNDHELAALEAKAQAARARSVRLTRAAPHVVPATAPTSPVSAISVVSAAPAGPVQSEPRHSTPSGGRTLTVIATGYALAGHTATGLPAGWGVAAVDPALIPLGTHMTIPGYGDAVAADTGGSVVGSTIDLWFPSVGQANAWGRRTITIVLH